MKYNIFERVLIEILKNSKYFRDILYMFEEWKENAEEWRVGLLLLFLLLLYTTFGRGGVFAI